MSMQSWEKQPWEKPLAYQAFEVYRDIGLHRTVWLARQRFAEYHGKDAGINGKKVPSKTAMYEWSAKYNWVERARQFDEWEIENRRAMRTEIARLEWEAKIAEVRSRHERIARNMTTAADKGFAAIAKYLEDATKIEDAIEGRSGKGLSTLISALKQVAESGTALDERSLGIDSMMMDHEKAED